MRVLIQRGKKAQGTVNEHTVGQIGHGLLLFLGIHKDDTPDKIDWLANKIPTLRLFADDDEKMNRSLLDVTGDALVVSQFTLYGTLDSGRRPDFGDAALPETAFLLYEQFISELSEALDRPVHSGTFGALMDVSLINDGPVTFFLER